jgi:DeoR/GlpR family transcriptional regulator of sugar metabolism
MIKAERHDRILVELARRGAVGVQDLAALLDASPATIRRDVAELDRAGSVLRTHGGIRLPDMRQELPFEAKVSAYLPEKRRIGSAAAAMLPEGALLGCGGGTTVMQMIHALRRRELRVVTTAVNVAVELMDAPAVEVTLTGGTLRARTAEMVGHVAERTLLDLNLDVAAIGVDGLCPDRGLSTFDAAEAYVNRVLIGRAREVWVLADHSKLGEVRPAVIAETGVVTRLLTDAGADLGMLRRLEAAGIEIVLA